MERFVEVFVDGKPERRPIESIEVYKGSEVGPSTPGIPYVVVPTLYEGERIVREISGRIHIIKEPT